MKAIQSDFDTLPTEAPKLFEHIKSYEKTI